MKRITLILAMVLASFAVSNASAALTVCDCIGGGDSLGGYWYLLDDQGSPLLDGDYVYAAWTGPDGEIDSPDSVGNVTDDDSLLAEGIIDSGGFWIAVTVNDSGEAHPWEGETIYCRIFDGPKDSLGPGNYYGDSQAHQCQHVPSEEFYCQFPGDPGGGHTDTPLPTQSSPQVTVIYPNGGETLTHSDTITWAANDPDGGETVLLSIDLDYSSNAGVSWSAIDSNQANTGSYFWDLAGLTNGNLYLLRVTATDTTGRSHSDISDDLFSIDINPDPPQVTVIYPNGGETLTHSDTITWTAVDPDTGETALLSIDLDCSSNGGGSWSVIDTSQANTGSYFWDISGLPNGDLYLVRITATDTTGRSGYDISNAVFSIDKGLNPPQVAVIYPNGGETLTHSDTIAWTATDPDTGETALLLVDLDYSANAGGFWSAIDSNQINTGSYFWDISGLPDSKQYLVRVTATDTSGRSGDDISDAVFSIDINPDPPEALVTFPNGGEVLTQSDTITWTATDPDMGETVLLLVDLDYSDNAGASWSVIDSNQANTGSYFWDITGLPNGDLYLVRVTATDTSGRSGYDISDAVFSIEIGLNPPEVSVLYPNGGETLTQSDTITWTATDPDTGETVLLLVDLDYSDNAGASWSVIDTSQANTGSYSWDLSGLTDGDLYLVRVTATDTTGRSGFDISDAVFSIVNGLNPPEVTVLYPNGGEVLTQSDTIAWTATDPDTGETALLLVDLDYSSNGGLAWSVIDTSQANTGSYFWDMSGLPNGDLYLVRLTATDTTGRSNYDISDAVFSIDINPDPPEVTVVYPNGWETLTDSVTICWTATDPDFGDSALLSMDLDYSDNGGGSWSVIDTSQANTGSYFWDISGLADGDLYLVRVIATDTSGRSDSDISDAIFSILNTGPPAAISDLVATLLESSIHLSWTAVTVDTAGQPLEVDLYRIYRDTMASFSPDPEPFDSTADTFYVDASGVVGDAGLQHYYMVTAIAGGKESTVSGQVGEYDRILINGP